MASARVATHDRFQQTEIPVKRSEARRCRAIPIAHHARRKGHETGLSKRPNPRPVRITPAVCCYSMRYHKSTRWAVLGVVFLAWSLSGQTQQLLDHTAPLEPRGDLAAQ